MLISLDDVQWADPATLAALGSLTRQLAGHRILWLLAVRSGELGATEHTALLRLQTSDTLEITVGPLDEGAVAGVAADLLGAAPDPALLTALAEVGGQPFLLTELLRGLREEKLVEVRDGSARLVRPRAAARPPRLGRLPLRRGCRPAPGTPCSWLRCSAAGSRPTN